MSLRVCASAAEAMAYVKSAPPDALRGLRAAIDQCLRAHAGVEPRPREPLPSVSQRVCDSPDCTCLLYYPKGRTRECLHAEPVVDPCALVVFGLVERCQGSINAVRREIKAALGPYEPRHINVNTRTGIVFLAFVCHADAANAQLLLSANGMTCNFKCSNVEAMCGHSV